MSVRISCPSCKAALTLEESLRGKATRCQHCGAALRVPAASCITAPAPRNAPASAVAAGPADDDAALPENKPGVRRRGLLPVALIGCGVVGVAMVLLAVVA